MIMQKKILEILLKTCFIISLTFFAFITGYIVKKYSLFPSSIIEPNLTILKLKGFKNPFTKVNNGKKFNFKLNEIDKLDYKLILSIDDPEKKQESYFFKTKTKKITKVISKKHKVILWEKNKLLIKTNKNSFEMIDINGNSIWKKNYPKLIYQHHWGDINNKNIFLLFKKFVPKPNSILGVEKCTNNNQIRSDVVAIIDKESGDLIKELDLLNILKNYPQIYNKIKYVKYCNDPLHTNDVRFIDDINSKYYGKLILSARWDNLIFILNLENNKVEYYLKNMTLQQHSPRVLNDQLYIFDNMILNDDYKYGLSRVTQIDMNTNKIVGTFSGNEKYFFSATAGGRININQNKLFILDNNKGELVMLDCKISRINESCPVKKVYTTRIKEDDSVIPILIADVFE